MIQAGSTWEARIPSQGPRIRAAPELQKRQQQESLEAFGLKVTPRGPKSLAVPIVNIHSQNFYRFPSGTDLLHSSAMGTEQQEQQQEQSAEEGIGSMIGKIFVLALVAFFLWGYSTTLVAKLGLF